MIYQALFSKIHMTCQALFSKCSYDMSSPILKQIHMICQALLLKDSYVMLSLIFKRFI